MAELEIREARSDDLDVIVQFNRALARETEDITLDEAVVGPGVQAVLADRSKGQYWVATVRGKVIGQLLVTFEWSDWRNGLFLWIQSVFVDQAHRREGVFKALYQHVEREARRPGRCGLRLYVHDHNRPARAIYERLGMVAPGYSVLETPDSLRSSS